MLLFPILVCNAQTEDVAFRTYVDESTGWTTRYPASYHVMTNDEIAAVEGRGQEVMENALETELVLTHTNLLWIRKDAFNSFTSNSQPFDPSVDGPYEETEKLVREAILESFNSQGIEYDVKFGSTKIDGLVFTTMETTIYTPDRKKIILRQILFDRFIDGKRTLSFNINYNNESDKALLLAIISSSKLSKRK